MPVWTMLKEIKESFVYIPKIVVKKKKKAAAQPQLGVGGRGGQAVSV